MNEQMGKGRFDAIEIPAELDAAVKSGLQRGRRRLAFRRTMSSMAAVVALVFLTANIPPLYARAAEVPLLAPLVRVMRMGNGGQEASGAVAHIQSEQDRVSLTFTNGGTAVPVPVFSAAQRKAPQRVILRLHGLAQGTPLGLAEALLKQSGVADAYTLSVTDPEEQGVAIHLRPGWTCAVSQYEQALELQFTKTAAEQKAETFLLCSQPLSPGEELAELTEALLWEGATQLRTPAGDYYVVLGEFATEEQANRAQKSLRDAKKADLQVAHLVDGALQVQKSHRKG